MRRPARKQEKHTLRLAGEFLFVVAFFIILSFAFRFYILIESSQYSGDHRFTIGYIRQQDGSRVLSAVVSFAPDTHTISELLFPKPISLQAAQSALLIPFDATIIDSVSSSKNTAFVSTPLQSSLFSLLLAYGKLKTTLTSLDLFRLWLFAGTVDSSAVTARMSTVEDLQNDASNQIEKLFTDSLLVQDHKTIAIVNASGVLGLGSKLSKFMTNIGGNVVSVTTATVMQHNSTIAFTDDESYTTKRLSAILRLPVQESQQQLIADVLITLGEEYPRVLK